MVTALFFLLIFAGTLFFPYWFVRHTIEQCAEGSYQGKPGLLLLLACAVSLGALLGWGSALWAFVELTPLGGIFLLLMGLGGAVGWFVLWIQKRRWLHDNRPELQALTLPKRRNRPSAPRGRGP